MPAPQVRLNAPSESWLYLRPNHRRAVTSSSSKLKLASVSVKYFSNHDYFGKLKHIQLRQTRQCRSLDICLSFVGRSHHYAWLPPGYKKRICGITLSLHLEFEPCIFHLEVSNLLMHKDVWRILAHASKSVQNKMKSQKKISWHEWFNLICVNIGFPDQTRHLKCSS